MSAFSAVVSAARRPLRVVSVPPSAFADTWDEKPGAPVLVGLRLIAEDDIQTARAEAAKVAWSLHDAAEDEEGRVEAFNDALMRWAVARAMTAVDNVAVPFFELAEETVKLALTSDGVRHIFAELELLSLAESPLSPEASVDDIAALAGLMAADTAFDHLSLAAARRIRRLLRHCLDELKT